MNRPSRALLAFLVASAAGAQSVRAQETGRPPNFVIILADDMGSGDISPYRGSVQAPALDRLAAEGMRFSAFYANGPVCTPTRAALLTGRYQQRAGLESVLYAQPQHPMQNRSHGLGTHEITFADVLRDAGYATGIFGKWHLGYEQRYNPVHHGFDRFRGFVSGNVDYFSHVDGAGYYDWWQGDRLINEPGYVTHLISRAAVEFIEDHRDRPFALYVAHQAPHFPFQGPGDAPFRLVGGSNQAGNRGEPEQVRRAYREMIEEMDKGIGEVVETLRRLGLAENTLVVFLSDHGALEYGSNGNFKGYKGSVWEGGLRIPAIAWWPGRIRPASYTDQPAITHDLMPTMLALARANVPAGHVLDGINLWPVLQGGKLAGERTLFWQYEGQAAVRQSQWKLVVDGLGEKGIALFDLARDAGETTNLAARNPERVRRLTDLLAAWRVDVARGATTQPAPGASASSSARRGNE